MCYVINARSWLISHFNIASMYCGITNVLLSPGCCDSGFRLICILGSGVSHLPPSQYPIVSLLDSAQMTGSSVKCSNNVASKPSGLVLAL